MAISKAINFKGIEVADAYIRVMRVECNKSTMNFVVGFFAKFDEDAFHSTTVNATYQIDGDNPIAQAYAHLKTMPEFAGAVDC